MHERLKVLLLIPHLGGGGAERVVAQLARSLDPDQFETHLALITQDRPGAEEIPAWVEVHRLECRRVRDSWRQLLGLVWEERPDLVFSGMAHVSFVVLLLKPFLPRRTRVIVRQNTTASMAADSWLERRCYRFLYPRADAIVCQSEAMAGELAEVFGLSRDRMQVLRNPVDLDGMRCGVTEAGTAGAGAGEIWPEGAWPRLLSVGRLSAEKGFDLLLGAMDRLRPRYPCIHAIVLGEGDARDELELLRGELDLADAVSFAGYRSDWAEFCGEADLFVLSSRYEGMPNALLEAAAVGLPLVATPCSGGVVEILQDAPGAWISSAITVEALADAIALGMESLGEASSPPVRPTRFNHAFLGAFERGRAVADYAELFQRIAAVGEAD
jgi:glycosyltransferase involved in cell wall biosynthesis